MRRPISILHLEDNNNDAVLLENVLKQAGITGVFVRMKDQMSYREALESGRWDLILVDNAVPGFDGRAALRLAHSLCPEIPAMVLSGSTDQRQIEDSLKAGASDYLFKDRPDQTVAAIRRLSEALEHKLNCEALTEHNRAMARLVTVVQELSVSQSLDAIMVVVRRAARELTGADGSTFVLRDGDQCHYADEDAIGPLWKGQRFPLSACISGWAMSHGQPVMIPDIYQDKRVPLDAYRPTFVKSLLMVPIRSGDPMGAIGTYWAGEHTAPSAEIELLQSLANTTAVAMENVRVHVELEQRVKDRTRQLELANQELETFTYAVSHDLRAPLRHIGGYTALLRNQLPEPPDESVVRYLENIEHSVRQMSEITNVLLNLARITTEVVERETVHLSRLAAGILYRLQLEDKDRISDVVVEPDLVVEGDPAMLRVVMENLLGNAWKYSARKPETRIEIGRAANCDGTVVFFVRDQGAGFDMKHADKLFLPFERLHRQDQFSGTGVGLATVQRILHRHGGRIWAQSAVGRGATFYFTVGCQTTTADTPNDSTPPKRPEFPVA